MCEFPLKVCCQRGWYLVGNLILCRWCKEDMKRKINNYKEDYMGKQT